ncbi:MAG: HD domain-containing protein [Clostridiales bacterium]|nr:HD domain-containing protein [Clostridiales bacterium]
MGFLNEENIKAILKSRLQEKRYIHSLNVMEMAVRLARLNNVNEEDAKFAGLLHDCAKNYTGEDLIAYCLENNIHIDDIKMTSPGMLHAEVGADIAEKEFCANERIVQAIKYHTLANSVMSKLDKILYVSDLIEEGRELEGVDEIRKIALDNLDKGYIESLKYCIDNVKERGKEIHPQSMEALEAALRAN